MNNSLYPIFLKLDQVKVLIIGSGDIAVEKLRSISQCSPNSLVTILATETISDDLRQLIDTSQTKLITKTFEDNDVQGYSLIIAATGDSTINQQIYTAAKHHQCLVNVADTPSICDFYLGSIVNKGSLKIAISTNGQSPTVAKRLKQILDESIPQNINQLMNNLNQLRQQFKGSFSEKVSYLNGLTASLLEKK